MVVGRVVVSVVHGVLVVPLFEAEGDRHEHVDVVVFAVDMDLNVAAFGGFGGGDDAPGGFVSPEGGDLWFGGSFGSFSSFGSFDHFWFVLWLILLLLSVFQLVDGKSKSSYSCNWDGSRWCACVDIIDKARFTTAECRPGALYKQNGENNTARSGQVRLES